MDSNLNVNAAIFTPTTLIKCNVCCHYLKKQQFSSNQLKHKRSEIRRCKACISNGPKINLQKQIENELTIKQNILFQNVLHNLQQFEAKKFKHPEIEKFDKNICKPLIHLFPNSDQFRRLVVFVPRSFKKYFLNQIVIHIRAMMIDRICNAFKYDTNYGIFVAVAFRGFANNCFLYTFGKSRSLKEDMNRFLNWYKKRRHHNFIQCLPTTLRSKRYENIKDFIKNSVQNDAFEEFDDEGIKLRHNPIPYTLFNKQIFIQFVLKNNKYLIYYMASLIYEYLSGYLFHVKLDGLEIVECYKFYENDSNETQKDFKIANKEIVKALSLNEPYTIKLKKMKHDFGNVNVLEFHCLGNKFCLSYIHNKYCRDNDGQKYSVLIKAILDHYNCDCNNFRVIDFQFGSKKTRDNKNQLLLQENILRHCRKNINSEIQGTERYRKAQRNNLMNDEGNRLMTAEDVMLLFEMYKWKYSNIDYSDDSDD